MEEYAKKQRAKKRIQKIKDNIGCFAAPILAFGLPFALFIGCCHVLETTEVGGVILNVWTWIWVICYFGTALFILIALGCCIYSMVKSASGSESVALLAAIVGVILFIFILTHLPEGCTHFDPDHVHRPDHF